jgi:hypothetical protein
MNVAHFSYCFSGEERKKSFMRVLDRAADKLLGLVRFRLYSHLFLMMTHTSITDERYPAFGRNHRPLMRADGVGVVANVDFRLVELFPRSRQLKKKKNEKW